MTKRIITCNLHASLLWRRTETRERAEEASAHAYARTRESREATWSVRCAGGAARSNELAACVCDRHNVSE